MSDDPAYDEDDVADGTDEEGVPDEEDLAGVSED